VEAVATGDFHRARELADDAIRLCTRETAGDAVGDADGVDASGAEP
jgi:hypothetical protein